MELTSVACKNVIAACCLPLFLSESYMKSRSHCFGSTMLRADQTTMDSSSQSSMSCTEDAEFGLTCTYALIFSQDVSCKNPAYLYRIRFAKASGIEPSHRE